MFIEIKNAKKQYGKKNSPVIQYRRVFLVVCSMDFKSLFYVECSHTRIASRSAKLLLDAEKLIVLCNTL